MNAQDAARSLQSRMLRVLFVDDCQDDATMWTVLAKIWGFEGLAAFDGRTAIAAAERFQPDVVVVDIGLPDMTGWELIERLKSLKTNRPQIVVVSGWSGPAFEERAAKADCSQCFVKPADLREVRQALADCERDVLAAESERLLEGLNEASLDENVKALAEARLMTSPYRALHAIECEFARGLLVLRGRLATFYLKQIAQSQVKGIGPVLEIENRIDVPVSEESSATRL